MGITIKDYQNSHRRVSAGRIATRYSISVLACLLLIGSAFTVIGLSKLNVETITVLSPLGIPLLLVWLSTLTSAFLSKDRRGWHDKAAGTIVIASRPLSETSPMSTAPADARP